jgi:hypothetical protein
MTHAVTLGNVVYKVNSFSRNIGLAGIQRG